MRVAPRRAKIEAHEYHRQHLHLISNRLSNGCDELDGKLQNLIIGIAKNQATFDELKVLIEAENTSSKQHVSQELEKVRIFQGDFL